MDTLNRVRCDFDLLDRTVRPGSVYLESQPLLAAGYDGTGRMTFLAGQRYEYVEPGSNTVSFESFRLSDDARTVKLFWVSGANAQPCLAPQGEAVSFDTMPTLTPY